METNEDIKITCMCLQKLYSPFLRPKISLVAQLDKQSVLLLYSRLLHRSERSSSATRNILGESEKCYAKWKNPPRIGTNTAGNFQLHILYSVYSFLEKAKS